MGSTVLTPPAATSEWGAPGVPLLPKALREAWTGETIPAFALRDSYLAEGTTLDRLDTSIWDTMPSLPPALERYLLQLVKDRFHDISALPIFDEIGFEDVGWSPIVGNALKRAGLFDLDRLRTLTYGDVLALRGIGVRRMLELAVVAECHREIADNTAPVVTADGSGLDIFDKSVDTARLSHPVLSAQQTKLRWGQPGAALLPRSLRSALATVRPPTDLIKRLELPADTTLAAFDATIWRHIPNRPQNQAILERFLVTIPTTWRETIEDIPALGRPWPTGLPFDAVPWRTRTRHALMRGKSNRFEALSWASWATYGDLLNVRNMGPLSVLDFVVTAEEAIDRFEAAEREAAAKEELAVDALQDVVGPAWAETIVEDDPRFADMVAGATRSTWASDPVRLGEFTEQERTNDMSEVAARTQPEQLALFTTVEVQAAVERARELQEMPLDLALRGYMEALSGATGPRLEALLMRFGWDGMPPRTLEESAGVAKVTRERMRQIQQRVMKKKPHDPVFLPAIDRALSVLAEAAPIAAADAAQLLHKQNITTVPFHPASVLAAAEFSGHAPTFSLDAGPNGPTVVTTSALAYANRVVTLAARLAGGSGASNIAEVEAVATATGIDISAEQVRETLVHYSKVRFLTDDWFWTPEAPIDRNRLYNVTRRILSVAHPVAVGTLRDGVRRHFRQRQHGRPLPLIVPPRAVLLAFYEAHPAFVVTADGQIDSTEPLDYRTLLGDTERTLVEILRSSPSGILPRQELADACAAHGIKPTTFDAYLTYSAIIEHLGTGIWGLRGAPVDPVAVEALRGDSSLRTRARRVVGYGWTADSELWLTWRVAGNSVHSAVIGIPAAIARYVGGQSFEATASDDGSAVGTITVSESNNVGAYNSWGYSPFLTRRGADDGDVLRVRFDIVTNQATLTLEDEESLSSDELPSLEGDAADVGDESSADDGEKNRY